jgi:hypothetical protein
VPIDAIRVGMSPLNHAQLALRDGDGRGLRAGQVRSESARVGRSHTPRSRTAKY